MADPWCLAKMTRFLGLIGDLGPSKVDLVDEFALAAFLEKETFANPETGVEERFIKFGTLRHELESVEGPIEKGCIDFIESLLVIDHTKRPSANKH